MWRSISRFEVDSSSSLNSTTTRGSQSLKSTECVRPINFMVWDEHVIYFEDQIPEKIFG